MRDPSGAKQWRSNWSISWATSAGKFCEPKPLPISPAIQFKSLNFLDLDFDSSNIIWVFYFVKSKVFLVFSNITKLKINGRDNFFISSLIFRINIVLLINISVILKHSYLKCRFSKNINFNSTKGELMQKLNE